MGWMILALAALVFIVIGAAIVRMPGSRPTRAGQAGEDFSVHIGSGGVDSSGGGCDCGGGDGCGCD